jgi:hypothetical protein
MQLLKSLAIENDITKSGAQLGGKLPDDARQDTSDDLSKSRV